MTSVKSIGDDELAFVTDPRTPSLTEAVVAGGAEDRHRARVPDHVRRDGLGRQAGDRGTPRSRSRRAWRRSSDSSQGAVAMPQLGRRGDRGADRAHHVRAERRPRPAWRRRCRANGWQRRGRQLGHGDRGAADAAHQVRVERATSTRSGSSAAAAIAVPHQVRAERRTWPRSRDRSRGVTHGRQLRCTPAHDRHVGQAQRLPLVAQFSP